MRRTVKASNNAAVNPGGLWGGNGRKMVRLEKSNKSESGLDSSHEALFVRISKRLEPDIQVFGIRRGRKSQLAKWETAEKPFFVYNYHQSSSNSKASLLILPFKMRHIKSNKTEETRWPCEMDVLMVGERDHLLPVQMEMGVSCAKTWQQIKVNSFSGDTERRGFKRIYGEWSLSAHVVQKSSYTSKFQLSGEACGCSALLILHRKRKPAPPTLQFSEHKHTQRKSPHLQLPEPFWVTTAVCLMLLHCSVTSVAIEFVPLKRIRNLNSAGLCEASVTCMTATITPRVNLSGTLRLTVITTGT